MTRTTLEKTATAGVRKVAFYQRLAKSADHFVGVNKMIPAGQSERCVGLNAEARELEERIAENVAELLEA